MEHVEGPDLDENYPKVSVIVPVRNGAGTIDACLSAVLAQVYPGDLEVVVADGMSTDGTAAVLDDWAASDPRVRVVPNPRRSTPAGLNLALRASTGAVVARCDVHAELPPHYLRRAVQLLADTGASVVGGVQRAVGQTPTERAVAMAMTSRFGVGDSRFHYGGSAGPTDTVYLGVFRRNVLDEVGAYDESLLRNQDYELNWRIRRAGGVVYLDPTLETVYRPRSSLGGLRRQYFDYGRWKRLVLSRSPGSLRWRQLAPPLLVVGLAASAVLLFTAWWRLGLLIPAGYALGLLAATVGKGVSERDGAALLLPAVFPTMHLGWGLGFLFGRVTDPTGTLEPGSSPSAPG